MVIKRSRYLVFPIAAFEPEREFDTTQLPLLIQTASGRTFAWICLVLGSFVLFGLGMIQIEDIFYPDKNREDFAGFKICLWLLCVALYSIAALAWSRNDRIRFDKHSIRIERCGLLGTDRREALISDYRGIRALERYIEPSESTAGTWWWDVTLEHEDPALVVSLFSKSFDVPANGQPIPAPGTFRDWQPRMLLLAKQWSNELGLPLIEPG